MNINNTVTPRNSQRETWPQLHYLPNVSKQSVTMFYGSTKEKLQSSLTLTPPPKLTHSVIRQIPRLLYEIQFPKLVLVGNIHTTNCRVFSLVLLTPIKHNSWSTALYISL